MTFPPPSAEQLAEWRLRDIEHDKKIQAAQQKLASLERKARLFPGDKYLPAGPLRSWIQKRVSKSSADDIDALADARIAYQWAIYDKCNRCRPLYPRRRAISPSNPKFRRKDPGSQKYFAQEQSPFFTCLPAEIRAEIYRALCGYWVVEIRAAQGFMAPPPSHDYRVYFGSKITDWRSGEIWHRGPGFSHTDERGMTMMKPWIVPMLRTCRRMYDEIIPLLYAENVFKSHGLNDAYADCATQAFAGMKGLRKLCILGKADGMINGKYKLFIDAELWTRNKIMLVELLRKLNFIKDVDVFLPIMAEILVQQGDTTVDRVRLHGLTRDQMEGKEDVHCACIHMPEKMDIRFPVLH